MKLFSQRNLKISNKLRNHLTYFEGKYLYKSRTDNWYLFNAHLKDTIFEKNSTNREYAKISYFNSFETKFFAIDIDNHNNNSYQFKNAYQELCLKFAEPSFVVKSPNGLHVYYLLSDFYSSQMLVLSVQNKLKKFKNYKSFEVRPTIRNGLRVPNKNFVLNVFDLDKRVRIKHFGTYLNKCIHYHPNEFADSVENDRTTKIIPSEIILQGATNMAMNYYVPLWRSKGLSEEEITDKFIDSLEPGYVGECTSRRRVAQRVHSYFKNFEPSNYVHQVSNNELEQKYEEVIRNILKLYSNKNKHNEALRLKSIKEDLLKVLSFYEISYKIYEDNELKYVHAEKNPYFLYEMSQDCVPVSSATVKAKNIIFFKKIGLFSLPHGKHYDTTRHSCIHYQFNFEKFSNPIVNPVIHVNPIINNIKFILVPVSPIICFKLFLYQNKENMAQKGLNRIKHPPDNNFLIK